MYHCRRLRSCKPHCGWYQIYIAPKVRKCRRGRAVQSSNCVSFSCMLADRAWTGASSVMSLDSCHASQKLAIEIPSCFVLYHTVLHARAFVSQQVQPGCLSHIPRFLVVLGCTNLVCISILFTQSLIKWSDASSDHLAGTK